MAYTIDRFNRTPLTTVEDGTLNETTDIKFVGKNYAGYGEIHNENFLFLMEHFAGANQPPKPVSGQIWYDTVSDRMKFRDEANTWRSIGGAEVAAIQPAGLAEGDFWWDSSNEQLYVFNGSTFILIGPQDAGEGVTQMVSQTILNETDQNKSVIVSFINDVPQFVISNEEFTIKNVPGNTLDGFTVLKKGITIRDTDLTTGVSTGGYTLFGTAKNAELLGGVDASNYVQAGSASFDSQISLDAGLIINDGFEVFTSPATPSSHAVIKNGLGPQSEIHFITLDTESNDVHSITISSAGITPGVTTGDYHIGTEIKPFDQVWATNFKGTADKADQLRLGLTGTDYRYASEAATPGTIAVRDSNNTITADIFDGTASQARFADLAEKYTTEKIWPVGTVMHICEQEEYEAAPCFLDSYPVGVVSNSPAYLMNKDIKGQALALEGRVPVRVIGSVKKGDVVYVDQEGTASTHFNGNHVVGIALETNSQEEEKLVECILRL